MSRIVTTSESSTDPDSYADFLALLLDAAKALARQQSRSSKKGVQRARRDSNPQPSDP